MDDWWGIADDFKCKMCGGDMDFAPGQSVVQCPYCGTKQTFPSTADELLAKMHNRANRLRMQKEFDKAQMVYESILARQPRDAEAHWCALLCRYGIEYVEDPYTHQRKPTMHRTQFSSVLEDAHYLAALENADAVAKKYYEREAALVEHIRRRYLAIASREEPFDVFICYKETDKNGDRTPDSVYAQEIYDELTRAGDNVFFARITLESKLGEAYEPYIFAALGSARVMLIVGTSAENMQSDWVKNEWTRYLYLMKQDNDKKLIPVFRDMDPSDMPEEFVYLQSQDYGKLGAMQDLLRGVEKIIGKTVPAAPDPIPYSDPSQPLPAGVSVDSLMRRAHLFLEDCDFASADAYFNKVLDINPEYAPAYVGRVLAAYQLRSEFSLMEVSIRYERHPDWIKAMRFATPEQKVEYQRYLDSSSGMRELERLQGILDQARKLMTGDDPDAYARALELLKTLPPSQTGKELEETCLRRIEELREQRYQTALKQMHDAADETAIKQAVQLFEQLKDYKDSEQLVFQCFKKAALLKKDAEWNEAERQMRCANTANEMREAAKRFECMNNYKDSKARVEECLKKAIQFDELERHAARKRRRMVVGFLLAGIVGLISWQALKSLMLVEQKYTTAQWLMSQRDYVDAAAAFTEIRSYKDSSSQLLQAAHALAQKGRIRESTLAYRKAGSPDSLIQANALLPCAKLDASFNHIAAVLPDGTVAITGNNLYGEHNVSDWENIIAVSLGNKHTVGLRQDGTVVATGSNSGGQCNTTGWENITAISAGAFHTVGLKSDGTLVATGDNSAGQCDVQDWTDIIAVSAGDTHTVGLKSNGRLVTAGSRSYGKCNVNLWRNVASVVASANYTAAISTKGTLLAIGEASMDQLPIFKLTDIVALSASRTTLVALKADGTVLAVGDNTYGQCNTDDWTDVVAIAAGDFHTVALRADGSVLVVGGNTYGQHDAQAWNLL